MNMTYMFRRIRSCSDEIGFVRTKWQFLRTNKLYVRTNESQIVQTKTYLFVRIRICSDELSIRLKPKLSNEACNFFVHYYHKNFSV